MVLSMLSDPETEAPLLVFSRTPIVLSRDVPWMVEQLQSSQHEKTRRAWAEVISRAFDLREHDLPDVILEACQGCPILGERFAEFIKPAELDSVQAYGRKGRN
jgi:hypothetical protein